MFIKIIISWKDESFLKSRLSSKPPVMNEVLVWTFKEFRKFPIRPVITLLSNDFIKSLQSFFPMSLQSQALWGRICIFWLVLGGHMWVHTHTHTHTHIPHPLHTPASTATRTQALPPSRSHMFCPSPPLTGPHEPKLFLKRLQDFLEALSPGHFRVCLKCPDLSGSPPHTSAAYNPPYTHPCQSLP